MIAVKGRVSGKVQGVFFRKHVQGACLVLGLSGYAKNLPDGRVEVVLCGAHEAVAAGKAAVAQGSPDSQVSSVYWEELPAVPDTAGFAVL